MNTPAVLYTLIPDSGYEALDAPEHYTEADETDILEQPCVVKLRAELEQLREQEHTAVGVLTRQAKLEAVAQAARSALGVLEKDHPHRRVSSMSVDVLVEMLRRTISALERTP